MHNLAEAVFFIFFFDGCEYIDILSEFMTVKILLNIQKIEREK